ncbi:MAG: hypothetical protein ACUVS4_12735 [Chloroflexaceae bacterium]
MAVNSRRISSIEDARARRLALPRYLRLDGARYLLGLVFLLCLMSLIVLVQTGVVATRGYAISTLEAQKVNLLRERTRLQERQARAQSLERIRRRAEQIGMRPVQEQQIRYVALPELLAAAERTPVPPDTGSD